MSAAGPKPAVTPTAAPDSPYLLRRAVAADAEAISALIAPYAAADLMLPRPLGPLFEAIRDFHVALDPATGALVGCAALHVFDGELAEIKSLAVAAGHQGHGLAAELITRCLADARGLGLRRVFALVLRDTLWTRLGFTSTDRDSLPQKVWGECIYCPKFHRCDEVAVSFDLAQDQDQPA